MSNPSGPDPLGWLQSERQAVTSAGKVVGNLEPTHLVVKELGSQPQEVKHGL